MRIFWVISTIQPDGCSCVSEGLRSSPRASGPRARAWSIAWAGIDNTAKAARTEKMGTRQKTALRENHQPTPPATKAMKTFPAWSKAAFRPIRYARPRAPSMPSVIAAIAGPKTAPAMPIIVCAVRTTGKIGAAIARALTLSTPTPATTTPRFQRVASIKAPTGMDYKANDARNRRHDANRCLVPMLLSQQVNAEIGAEPAFNVGQKKVQPVERSAVRQYRLFRKIGHRWLIPR